MPHTETYGSSLSARSHHSRAYTQRRKEIRRENYVQRKSLEQKTQPKLVYQDLPEELAITQSEKFHYVQEKLSNPNVVRVLFLLHLVSDKPYAEKRRILSGFYVAGTTSALGAFFNLRNTGLVDVASIEISPDYKREIGLFFNRRYGQLSMSQKYEKLLSFGNNIGYEERKQFGEEQNCLRYEHFNHTLSQSELLTHLLGKHAETLNAKGPNNLLGDFNIQYSTKESILVLIQKNPQLSERPFVTAHYSVMIKSAYREIRTKANNTVQIKDLSEWKVAIFSPGMSSWNEAVTVWEYNNELDYLFVDSFVLTQLLMLLERNTTPNLAALLWSHRTGIAESV